ncbi:MAG: hypothetical protein K0R31_2222 [Clostridiales bacterium]|nr:hypothetical protein [Clostridiales bacterium]
MPELFLIDSQMYTAETSTNNPLIHLGNNPAPGPYLLKYSKVNEIPKRIQEIINIINPNQTSIFFWPDCCPASLTFYHPNKSFISRIDFSSNFKALAYPSLF